MELWQNCLVGLGVTVFSGMVGCLCYYCWAQYHKSSIRNDEEQHKPNNDSPACSMDENQKMISDSSLNLAVSPSPSPPPPCYLTELSAPPIHFFHRSDPSRQVPLPYPAVSTLSNSKDIRRCLSLSPFLGQKPSSPERMTTTDSHSPSPALSKITSSWSSWKRRS
ncbi:hypothetical protein BCR42DRAFT_425170 [Absidia repens]|uniref:Uncharacterized protein n=1 Tax=Absidia repens TaxID=90262 RepID=A0A1X2I2H8_9FUNG|nr:hypothetical protein BCR42DRAFT_425170 [Absidia repens]